MESLLFEKGGTKITTNMKRIGDLVYYEGPMLTLYKDIADGYLYLADWVDKDTMSNRWLVYRISPLHLIEFINANVSHFTMFENSPDKKYYVVDIKKNYTFSDCVLEELSEVPLSYLPNKDNYFDHNLAKGIEKVKAMLIEQLTIKA